MPIAGTKPNQKGPFNRSYPVLKSVWIIFEPSFHFCQHFYTTSLYTVTCLSLYTSRLPLAITKNHNNLQPSNIPRPTLEAVRHTCDKGESLASCVYSVDPVTSSMNARAKSKRPPKKINTFYPSIIPD